MLDAPALGAGERLDEFNVIPSGRASVQFCGIILQDKLSHKITFMRTPLTPAEQRLREMEILLRWEGQLDNARVREVFGIQAVQASRLLSAFMSEFGDVVTRVTPHAPITGTDAFKPKFAGSAPDEYLHLLQKASTPGVGATVEDLRLDLAPISPAVFSLATQACRQQIGLRIQYRSLSQPEEHVRLIFPHCLVRAARRWHIRAWCTERSDFRDFVLGRIGSASLDLQPSPVQVQSDAAWHEYLDLVVVSHPALPEPQAQLLRDEYFSGARSRILHVRRCLAGYTVQDLRIAVNAERQLPPAFQLALASTQELGSDFLLGE
ncbi:WYL domain-containing protein [Burkholderia pseudomallei]|uniref:WYL domain-containing protein n=1 Tax=Burkholderia pseudomallei TaxID=28450 RepID=UPI001F4CFC77|nr:WYL domain-containing protein [Burkholderia pseudomallei]